MNTLDDQGFKILGQKSLPNLKTIECELCRTDCTQESFSYFLENSPSLEYIEIKSLYNPLIAFKIPNIMKNLLTIRITHWVGPIMLDSFVCGNVPNLKKLQLSHVSPSNIFIKENSIKTAPSVDYLAVNFGSGSHSIKKVVLRSFVTSFPNLKVFMMKKVSDKILEMICEGWPQLEALRLTTSFSLTDAGITGLPTSSLLQKNQKTECRLSCGCSVPFPVIDGKVDPKAKVAPNLAMLKSK
jgi:hypothetical protein